jgi:hypothetical protein
MTTALAAWLALSGEPSAAITGPRPWRRGIQPW